MPCMVSVAPTAYRAPSNAVFMLQKMGAILGERGEGAARVRVDDVDNGIQNARQQGEDTWKEGSCPYCRTNKSNTKSPYAFIISRVHGIKGVFTKISLYVQFHQTTLDIISSSVGCNTPYRATASGSSSGCIAGVACASSSDWG